MQNKEKDSAVWHEYKPGFTHREVEIMSLIARGLTNEEIKGRLVLSEHTIKAHICNIYQKLGICGINNAMRVKIALYYLKNKKQLTGETDNGNG